MEEEESEKIAEELARSVAEQLKAGIPRQDIIKGLTETGVSQFEAEQFVNYIEAILHEARRRAATKDLGWGFLLLAIGAAITIGTWLAAEEGGSYWFMWGAMVFGGFYLMRGFYRKISSTASTGVRLGWFLTGVLLVGGIVGGVIGVYNVMSQPELTPPSDSYIEWRDDSLWEDEIRGTLMINGVVMNNHDEWSLGNVEIEIEAKDGSGKIIDKYRISVSPDTIAPGANGVYSKKLQVSDKCAEVTPVLWWEWVPPE